MPTKIGPIDTLAFQKTAGNGMQIGTTYGWRDILGTVRPKTLGAGTPALATFRGGQTQLYSFVLNDVVDFDFHMPHDYAPGTDIYFHLHWAHNGTDISGDLVTTNYITYAKGFGQAVFSAEVAKELTVSGLSIANYPQYSHRVDEVQISAVSPAADQLDTDNLEVDGLVLIRTKITTLPTITGGSLFIVMGDIHYQSTGIPTKNKAPNFYT